MQKQKILILSLGTGNIFGKDVGKLTVEQKRERIYKKEFSYRPANYLMAGEEPYPETEFIAEPLIKAFDPDDIFIIGTSKSAWTGFYGKFGDGNNEILQRLFEIEEQGGKDVPAEMLRELSSEVEGCYRTGITHEVFRGRRIYVIMLCYGIDEKQLLDNYRLLSSIEAVLDREQSYEVAFDITHSFRSLPLYNLVTLNYLKSVLQIDLEISHIYYGNVEIAGENGGISPIVDLKELIGVLDLSGGISEFKNTGNAVSLLQYIPDEEEDLKSALEGFDWATQLNSYDGVADALENLLLCIERDAVSGCNKFTNLREMIASVIQLKFFGEEEGKRVTADDFRKMPIAQKQFFISRWYLRQNRYGQAVATALEALRSYLTPMLLEKEGKDVNDENLMKEYFRKQSVRRLKKISSKLISEYSMISETPRSGKGCFPKMQNEPERLFCELEHARKKAVRVRNVFAHNLRENSNGNTDEKIGGYGDAKEIIKDFIDKLDEFRIMLSKRGGEVKEFYQKEDEVKRVRVKRNTEMPARLVIAPPDVNIVYRDYHKASNGKRRYDVYAMPKQIAEYWSKAGSDAKVVRAAVFLAKYIADLDFDLSQDRFQVIIFDNSLARAMNLAASLKHFGVQSVSWKGHLMPAVKFAVDWDSYEEWELSDEERGMMGLDVIKEVSSDTMLKRK